MLRPSGKGQNDRFLKSRIAFTMLLYGGDIVIERDKHVCFVDKAEAAGGRACN